MKKYSFDAIKDGKFVVVIIYAMNVASAFAKAPEVLELEGYEFRLVSVEETVY